MPPLLNVTDYAQVRRSVHPGRLLLAALLAFSAAVAALAVTLPSNQPDPTAVLLQETLPAPAPVLLEADELPYVHEGVVDRGDTLSSLLSRLGARDAALLQFIGTSPAARNLVRLLRPGARVSVHTSRQGVVHAIALPQADAETALWVMRRDGAFVVETRPIDFERRVVVGEGRIHSSLFAAADAAGIPDAIAMELANVFGGKVDFHRGLQQGDRFKVVFEMLYQHGSAVRSGKIIAAEFENEHKRYAAVWFAGEAGGRGGYYSPEGRPMESGFLRAPLEFSRISSGFSKRFHPILNRWAAHRGIDFAAPTGTRVKAAADGVVEFAGVQGGYGNVVLVRHAGGIVTAYAHLSRIGARRGARVERGEVIGYVGSTGWATGPHLHYEFRANGVHKNPLTVVLPEAPPLGGARLVAFREYASGALAQLAREATPALAQSD